MQDDCERPVVVDIRRLGWWLAHIGLILISMWAGAKLVTACRPKGDDAAES